MKPRIIIVEDDHIIQMFLRNVIEELGFDIAGMANNGKEALDFIEKHDPDLILLDVGIRGEMNGIEIAKQVNADYQIPMVFITGNSDKKTYAQIQETHPLHIIRKPVDDEFLKKELTVVCRQMGLF